MNMYSNIGIENFSEPASFYPAHADPYHTDRYVNLEDEIRLLYNNDFDNYSDFSEETSSGLSFESSEYKNYKLQNDQIRSLRPEVSTLEETWMLYGDMADRHAVSPFELTGSTNSPLLSDDDMRNELFLLPEQEELQFFTNLVHEDIVAADMAAADCCAEFYSGAAQEAYVDIAPQAHDCVDLSNENTFMWNKFNREDCMSRHGILHENKMSSYNKRNVPVALNCKFDPRASKQMKPKERYPKVTSGHLLETKKAGKRGSAWKPRQALKEVSKVKKVSTHTTPNIQKQENDKSKAKVGSFPCDKSVSKADQKVFLGGLPVGMTERMLREQMSAKGYKVLKRPKIMRGFAPEVWLRSAEQAKELVAKGKIILEGVEVDVRPYNSLTKLSELKKIPNVGKRSIFLGGLPIGTTVKDLKEAIQKLGMKVLNYPLIKDGFSRQVILENVSQAKNLIKMKKILLNGKLVDVRPFVNQIRKNKTH